MKKIPQGSNPTVMLIWCLKQVKDFLLKFLRNGSVCWGTQNYYMCYIQYCSLPSGGYIDDVLVRLLVIKQVINDCNLMCISFSVKHPKIFWELWIIFSNMSRTISNMYKYPFNLQLVIETLVENHDKKPRDQRNFYIRTSIFKWLGVFQSWLDCFSIGVWVIIRNIHFSSSVVFIYGCSFVTIFKCCNLWCHYTFF